MTESEVIEELKHSIVSYEAQNKNNITCDLTREILGNAIKALEKQIPMKSTEINDECGYFECPACGDLIYAEGARFEEHKYCLSCGQKLDWSD